MKPKEQAVTSPEVVIPTEVVVAKKIPVPEEEQHQDYVVFKPNDGPQTDFLASSEREVLYGGAAGGGKSFAM